MGVHNQQGYRERRERQQQEHKHREEWQECLNRGGQWWFERAAYLKNGNVQEDCLLGQ